MRITSPFHSESRTIWYAQDDNGNCVGTLELGKFYRYSSGASYRLVSVDRQEGYVTVSRNGNKYLWRVESLLADLAS